MSKATLHTGNAGPLLYQTSHVDMIRENRLRVDCLNGLPVRPLRERFHESRKCSRDTYPESRITRYTTIRIKKAPARARVLHHGAVLAAVQSYRVTSGGASSTSTGASKKLYWTRPKLVLVRPKLQTGHVLNGCKMGARRFLPARAFCVKARSWRPCKVVERKAEDDTYTLKWADTHETEVPTPYTLHPTLCTLHPTPYTLHPTPYTPHPTPYTLHPTLFTPHVSRCKNNCIIWEGYREGRRYSRDTYPESYITNYTSIRRQSAVISNTFGVFPG